MIWRLVCWLKRKHRFGRPHFEHLGGGVYATVGARYKTCRRCQLTVRVIPRPRRAKGAA